MEYTIAGLIAVQALLALILYLQNRQLDAHNVIVALAMEQMIDDGTIQIVDDDDADEYY